MYVSYLINIKYIGGFSAYSRYFSTQIVHLLLLLHYLLSAVSTEILEVVYRFGCLKNELEKSSST